MSECEPMACQSHVQVMKESTKIYGPLNISLFSESGYFENGLWYRYVLDCFRLLVHLYWKISQYIFLQTNMYTGQLGQCLYNICLTPA